MNPQVFGIEHIIYLVVATVLTVLTLILAKKFCKTEKSQKIFIKIIALLLLISVVICRIAICINCNTWIYLIPNTFCGLTSLAFSLFVLFGKPNMKVYNCLWYMALVGGLVTIVYPDFISQDKSFFFLATISSFLHHSLDILLCIALLMFKWFTPKLKEAFYFPLGFLVYILIGYFEIYVLKADSAMCITKPLLSGTPFNCWFILGVGTALVVIFCLIVELFRKKKTKKIE